MRPGPLPGTLFVLFGLALTVAAKEPAVERAVWGKTADGTPVELYTLTNGKGLEARVMTLGATLTVVSTPDRQGKPAIVTLHRPDLAGYLKGHPSMGSLVGRFANRIAGAKFTLDSVEYQLDRNTGVNHIHGGKLGFGWRVWQAGPLKEADAAGVRLTLVSTDKDQGYPGTVRVTVVYKVTTNDELVMDYTATTDKPTHINLTNHAYWNLGGAETGEIKEHILLLNADRYLVADKDLIPTGEIRSVKDTALNFTSPRTIGARLNEVEQKRYDHCYVLNKQAGEGLSLVARVVEPKSGRVMEVTTTQPGVQFYTGNPRGLCLETQHFPNSPNEPRFPSTVLRPGETYRQLTVHRFRVQD